MFSLPPIDDPIRNALDAQVRHFSKLVGLANITVAIGVAIEGVELLHDALAWSKRRGVRKKESAVQEELAEIFPAAEAQIRAESNSDHPRWVKRSTRIGLIVVVLGVVAEWRCGDKLEDAHNAVHEYDLAKLTEADQKAGNAAKSAETAHGEADDVSKEVAVLKPKIKNASAKLAELTRKEGHFEDVMNGWKLPPQEQIDLAGKLKPFAKTPYDLSTNQLETEFMEELDAVLSMAEWSRQTPKPRPVNAAAIMIDNKALINTLANGIRIEVAQDRWAGVFTATKALQEGLSARGISCAVIPTPTLDDPNPGVVHIVIGRRQ
jgi:hypothetical protein